LDGLSLLVISHSFKEGSRYGKGVLAKDLEKTLRMYNCRLDGGLSHLYMPEYLENWIPAGTEKPFRREAMMLSRDHPLTARQA